MKYFALLLACLLIPTLASAQQRIVFTGRFQHDLAIVDSNSADPYKESNVRRVRFGARVTFLKDYLFHAELEVNPQEHNPFYVRFTDL